MAGIKKDNPFSQEGCDFGDPKCIVGSGCSKVSQTYQIDCLDCEQEEDQPGQMARGIMRAEVRGGTRRRKYIGHTGTSLHRRQKGHKSDKDSVITKHKMEAHLGDPRPPRYVMKPMKGSRTVLNRVITEGVFIDAEEKANPGVLMNSRGEGGRGKLVRYQATVRRI